MQTTLEEESTKVQQLTERLQHVEQNREELVRKLTDMNRSKDQLKTEFENYRTLNQTPESLVYRLKEEIDRLTAELSQLESACKMESSQCVDLATELSQQQHQNREQSDEIKQLRSALKENRVQLDNALTDLDDVRSELATSQERCRRIDQSTSGLTLELEITKEEMRQCQAELKQNKAMLEQTEPMLQELEYSTQQLTRQLEQSENLRSAAELASNQSTSETASMRIELVKLMDQLNRAQNMLTMANQQVANLETANKHYEVSLRDSKMEQSANVSTIQTLEKELVHMKQYAKEKDEEARIWREKHNQMHVELLNAQASFDEVSSSNQTQETIRSRLEMELKSLREARVRCIEQASQQETRLENLQNELRAERSKSLELSGLLSDKELLCDKAKNDAQELLRLKDEFSERLQERVSAFDALTRENSAVAARLANMTRMQTESEAELLETKQKLELIEARQQKYKDDNSKYISVISALEKRLIDRDRKLNISNPSADTCLIEPKIEEVRIIQLTSELKEMKRQIIEYKKSTAVSKVERAHLQDTVNRMQGELVARSDTLRHTVLELEKQRTDYENKLSNQEVDYQAALRQLETKFKGESDKVKQLEGKSNETERLLMEASSQVRSFNDSEAGIIYLYITADEKIYSI
ncbi:hypothetical protein PHET_09571 [Paragonimus heterotremus]|uniref:Uncharacterized protein n=1 Tax=Paragonimus heterotremus TaxID=100268 RepID=A0A8J4STE2_9TREM|nr:hypothetical protein PHET_09571 [Paragonimus heterotremus]